MLLGIHDYVEGLFTKFGKAIHLMHMITVNWSVSENQSSLLTQNPKPNPNPLFWNKGLLNRALRQAHLFQLLS